jgi:hypothetical protein
MMLQLWPVHDGGQAEHYGSERLFRNLRLLSEGEIISDRAAQTIAAWWHSPGKPYSTLLSTRGIVDRYTTLSDFGDPAEAETPEDAQALRALGAYIAHKQSTARSGPRPCACHDCFEITTGIPGELCADCAEWGCDATDARACCEVPGRYETESDPCGDPECDGCLYCIPGE